MKESGNKYSLQELLTSEDNEKIVIPDLQRDYCWGTTGTLVDDFIASLIGNFKNHPSDIMRKNVLIFNSVTDNSV